ncbi:hypothetical protein [Microbacterium sp. H83]|uniref:hypothetical protein n=1 Tax=Microbacterium sp. H83 TaxID=1827324 RepID=UPI0007F457F2|nr:hypothetical protein [Microbacterium sp. H83]OAN43215.1 hypothetical protein A4X16_08040 [Microbacterium sp. H83]
MSQDETNVEETVMLTRRERRRSAARADAAVEPDAPIEPDAPVEEDAPVDEATIVVDRSPAARVAAEARAAGDTSVEEEAPVDEATVVVDRSAGARPHSDVEGDAPIDDATVVVDRAAATRADTSDSTADAVSGAASGDSAPADASTESLFRAPLTPTPAIYRPRPAPLAPSAPPTIVGAAAPTRVTDVEQTSVSRQARRWSVYTLLAVVGACAVSVAGLVGLGFLVLG